MSNSMITVPENEFFTVKDTVEVIRGDYSQFVVGNLSVDQYVQDNLLNYYGLLNTWCNLALDIVGYAFASALSMRIRLAGLASTITVAANYAEFLIVNYHNESAVFDFPLPLDGFLKEAEALDFQSSHQILVFPKRFAPVVKPKYSALRQKTIDAFIATNNANRDEVVPRLDSLVAWHGTVKSQMYTHKLVLAIARRIVREILHEAPDLTGKNFPEFGPGSSRNCTNTVYHKFEYLVRIGAYTPIHQVPLLPFDTHPDLAIRKRRTKTGKKVEGNLHRPSLGGIGRFPQITAGTTVPKSYKTDRFIAKEDPANMSNQLALFRQILRLMKRSRFGKCMPITHQEHNQQLAYRACLTNTLATLDLSHASDSVTKRLVQLLVPDDWWTAFMRCIPVGFILSEHDQGPRALHTFATMGCGCTFGVETLVFFSIQMSCFLIALYKNKILTLKDIRDGNYIVPDDISSMGDDCVCPSTLAPFIIRELEWFGFSVNTDKSFISGPFRESCGKEFYFDAASETPDDVTAIYWPRIPLRGAWSELEHLLENRWHAGETEVVPAVNRLIALQHRLLPFQNACRFVTTFVRSCAPYMTVSHRDDGFDDLWSNPSIGLHPHGFKAYQIGEYVPVRFRRIDPTLIVPDGYVLIEYLDAYVKWRSTCPWCINTPILDLAHRTRMFHLSYRARCVEPNVEDYNYPLMEELRLELALTRESIPTGFPLIFNGFSPDHKSNLGSLLRLRTGCNTPAEAYGQRDVVLVMTS